MCDRKRESAGGGILFFRPMEYVVGFFINDIFFNDISFQHLE
jgi:hypothetical protein